ncbi:MAG: hypothetical protein WBA98_13665 [Gordonia sp. (in: high G+C Gram-positive bacteria)]|uniref:hypothetical protein n=1 Tax=Gordonia sp. (in: high G+C Gram-positive bacteria) TaxID=84139 RepID=UPI003C71618B
MTDMFKPGMEHADSHELNLRAAHIETAVGVGYTLDGEVFPLFKLLFTDSQAGPIGVSIDTRGGCLEHIHASIGRVLKAVHSPDEHPEEAAELHKVWSELLGSFLNELPDPEAPEAGGTQ